MASRRASSSSPIFFPFFSIACPSCTSDALSDCADGWVFRLCSPMSSPPFSVTLSHALAWNDASHVPRRLEHGRPSQSYRALFLDGLHDLAPIIWPLWAG